MNTSRRINNSFSERSLPGAPTLHAPQPTKAQLRWLKRGLTQPGGKIPLFDNEGQKVNNRTVQICLEHGWVEPWFANPIKPDWIVCKLTAKGRTVMKMKEAK